MLKHHKLISIALGLLFLIIVQQFAAPQPIFRFLFPAILAYGLLVWFYNRWYLKQISRYNFWVLIRPTLLLVGAFGVVLFIPSFGLRGLFLTAAVACVAFFEALVGNLAENILLNETLLIAFGLFFTFFAQYYYAPSAEPWYLLGVFLSSSLLARSFYEAVPRSQKVKAIGAISIGLFCSELYWALNFLDFHYSVLALFLFNIFYFCLILNYYHLLHMLNFKKVKFHLLLIAACGLLALLATPWSIIQ